jgi:hypothetical protein
MNENFDWVLEYTNGMYRVWFTLEDREQYTLALRRKFVYIDHLDHADIVDNPCYKNIKGEILQILQSISKEGVCI